MNRKKILYILPAFGTSGPRNNRGQHISNYLSEDHDVYIFRYKNDHVPIIKDRVKVIQRTIPFGILTLLNPELIKYKTNYFTKIFSKICRKILKGVLRPDPMILYAKSSAQFIAENIPDLDIIICSIFPFSSGTLGKILKLNYFQNAKLILDIGDPLSFNAVKQGFGKKYEFKFEKDLLQKADQIIVTNIATGTFYNTVFNFDIKKTSVIPQGVNRSFFERQGQIKKVFNQKIRIIYAGAFYKKLRDPSILIKALIQTNLEDTLVLHVYGNIRDFYDQEITCIKTFDKIKNEDLINKYYNSDVLLYFDNAFGIQTSGKIYELVSTQLPILFIYSDANSDTYKKFRHFENIIFCYNDLNSLTTCLQNLPKKLETITKPDYDSRKYSWESRGKLFDLALSKVYE